MRARKKDILYIVTMLVALLMFMGGCSSPEPTKQQIDVIVLTPLTGPASAYATYSKMGFELAEKEIRNAGNINLNVRYIDTKSNPKDAVSALNQTLLVKRADVVVSQLSSVLKAVWPILEQQKIPTIANAVAAPNVAKPELGLFRVFPTSDDVARKAVKLAVNNSINTIAMVYVNDEYGVGSKESLVSFAEGKPLKIITTEAYSIIEKDFRNQWIRILAEKPECVFIVGYGPGYVAVLQQLGEQNYQGTVITDFTLSHPLVLKATGGVKEGTYVITPRINSDFEKKAKEAFPNAAYFVNVTTAYDTIRLVAAAAEGDKTLSLTQRIGKVKLQNGAFGMLHINDNGDEEIPLSIFQVKNGELVGIPTIKNER